LPFGGAGRDAGFLAAVAAVMVAVLVAGGTRPRAAPLVACDLNGSDAGAASDAPAATGTVQDQCTKIMTAYCQRESDCLDPDFPGSISQCITDRVATCCVGSTQCNSAAQTPDTYITACVNDIASLDCNSVATDVSPTSCLGLPKKP